MGNHDQRPAGRNTPRPCTTNSTLPAVSRASAPPANSPPANDKAKAGALALHPLATLNASSRPAVQSIRPASSARLRPFGSTRAAHTPFQSPSLGPVQWRLSVRRPIATSNAASPSIPRNAGSNETYTAGGSVAFAADTSNRSEVNAMLKPSASDVNCPESGTSIRPSPSAASVRFIRTSPPSKRPSRTHRTVRPSNHRSSPVSSTSRCTLASPCHSIPSSNDVRAMSATDTIPDQVTGCPSPFHSPSNSTSRSMNRSMLQLSRPSDSPDPAVQNTQFSWPERVRCTRKRPPSSRSARMSRRSSNNGHHPMRNPSSSNCTKSCPRSMASSTRTSWRMTSTSGHADHSDRDTDPTATSVAKCGRTASMTRASNPLDIHAMPAENTTSGTSANTSTQRQPLRAVRWASGASCGLVLCCSSMLFRPQRLGACAPLHRGWLNQRQRWRLDYGHPERNSAGKPAPWTSAPSSN